MKLFAYIILIAFIILIILPFFIVKSCDLIYKDNEPKVIEEETKIYVKVLDTKRNIVMNLDLDEYIKGVVAAEMPVSFDLEALKAQAVAARTYTIRRLQQFGAKPSSTHSQYDICTDPGHCQAWISKEDRFKAWDGNTELAALSNISLWKKIEDAVTSTKGVVIIYNGNLIDPLFHSTSGGKTENSEDYFTNNLPYLRSVFSQFENHSPFLITNTTIKIDEFIKKMKKNYPDITFNKSKIIDEIEVLSKTEGNQIENIRVGNKILSGREFREVLSLRSSQFEIEQRGTTLYITVTGYGHGVGMSQYGADGMAKEGYTYEEIIKHYYTSVELVEYY